MGQAVDTSPAWRTNHRDRSARAGPPAWPPYGQGLEPVFALAGATGTYTPMSEGGWVNSVGLERDARRVAGCQLRGEPGQKGPHGRGRQEGGDPDHVVRRADRVDVEHSGVQRLQHLDEG